MTLMIDRVVLHGRPGGDPEVPYVRLLERPFEGDPPLTMTVPMYRLRGAIVTTIDVHYTYSRTDECGIPHYRARCHRTQRSPHENH